MPEYRSNSILRETENGTYYTGPLDVAIRAMRDEYGDSITVEHRTDGATYRHNGGGSTDLGLISTGDRIEIVREYGDDERDPEVGRVFEVRILTGVSVGETCTLFEDEIEDIEDGSDYWVVTEHRGSTSDSPNQWGSGPTEEEAWRYFIGTDFGPLDQTYEDEGYEHQQRRMLGLDG